MTRSHPELNIWSATTYLCTAKLPTPQASDTPGFQSLLTSAATAAVRAASAPVSLLHVDGSPCLRLRAPRLFSLASSFLERRRRGLCACPSRSLQRSAGSLHASLHRLFRVVIQMSPFQKDLPYNI